MKIFLSGVAFAICTASMIQAAHSEIGAPASHGGIYVSVEAGYNKTDAPNVAAQGPSEVVDGTVGGGGGSGGGVYGTTDSDSFNTSSSAGFARSGHIGVGPESEANSLAISGTESAHAWEDGGSFIGAGDGVYGGASIGYVMSSRLFGIFSRFEGYGLLSKADEDQSGLGAVGFRAVDNFASVAFAAVPIDEVSVSIDQTVRRNEFGFRLKSDLPGAPLKPALSVEPFYIDYNQDTKTHGVLLPLSNPESAVATRSSDVDGDFFGVQIAAEGVVPLFANVSLVGRGSAGVYHIESDADFRSVFKFTNSLNDLEYVAHVRDSSSGTGYRLGAESGLRFALSDMAWLSVTGQVDYLSKVPTAALPRGPTDPVAHIKFEDMFDWRVGARLTWAVGN